MHLSKAGEGEISAVAATIDRWPVSFPKLTTVNLINSDGQRCKLWNAKVTINPISNLIEAHYFVE